MDFAIPTDPWVKVKEGEKAWQILGPWHESDNDTIIKALRTVTKNLEKRFKDLKIRGRINTIQTTALLISTRKIKRVL